MLQGSAMPHVCENYKRQKNYWADQSNRPRPFPELEVHKDEDKLDLVLKRHDAPLNKPKDVVPLILVSIVVAIVAAIALSMFILA